MTGESSPPIAEVYEETVGGNPIVALFRTYVPDRAGVFAVAVVSTVLNRLVDLVPPYLLGLTLDAFFTGQSDSLSIAFVPAAWIPARTRGQFALVAGLFVAATLATALTRMVQLLSFRWFQQSVLHALRTDAYAATQRLDLAFFDTRETGDVMSVLNNDVNQLRDLCSEWLRQAVELATLVVGLLAVMLALHWQLTVLALAFLPVMLALVAVYQRAVEPRYDDRRSAVGAVNAHVQTAVGGIETIKAFGTEARERDRLRARSRSFWRADWHAARLAGLFYPTRTFLTEVTSLTIVVVGGLWALFGPPPGFTAPLTTGTFVTFLFYGRWLVSQSANIGDLVDAYTDAKASAKRVLGLRAYPATVTDADDAAPLDTVDGAVEYRDVTFTYSGADAPALRDVSFCADAGHFVGLVGQTGAGKSTALKLLPRFYDPDDGAIAVDGTDVSAATLESLRDAIGYVSQDPFLFDRSVRENIAYGDPDASREEIVAAAKQANAHEFVRDLPEGYDTGVGERGVRLSGGQRQRIALARTLLRDPDVLLLDEATSHVDNRTELLIHDSLADVVRGRTTLAVAHRLSTVRDADLILMFDGGEIVERGRHEDLLAEDGVYADLWRVHVGDAESVPDRSVAGVASVDEG